MPHILSGKCPGYDAVYWIYRKKQKKAYCLPLVSAALFLVGTWIFFDMGETAFILYAAVYLVLGIAAMIISRFIRMKTQRLNGIQK